MAATRDDTTRPAPVPRLAFALVAVPLLLVGVFDYFIARAILVGRDSLSWPSTTATIITSEVEESEDGEGDTTYAAAITYRYTVNGTTHTGDDVTSFNLFTSDSGAARQTVARYPVGAEVPVFYDPAEAGRSLLEPGEPGVAWMGALMLMPFNTLALGLLAALLGSVRARHRPDASVALRRSPTGFRIRVKHTSALRAAAMAFGLSTFISVFVVGLSVGMTPSGSTVGLVLAVSAGLGLAFAVGQNLRIGSGRYDVIADTTSGTVSLPAGFERAQRVELSIPDIASIDRHRHVVRSDDSKTTSHRVVITTRTAGGDTEQHVADERHDRTRAEITLAVLARELGVGPTD